MAGVVWEEWDESNLFALTCTQVAFQNIDPVIEDLFVNNTPLKERNKLAYLTSDDKDGHKELESGFYAGFKGLGQMK